MKLIKFKLQEAKKEHAEDENEDMFIYVNPEKVATVGGHNNYVIISYVDCSDIVREKLEDVIYKLENETNKTREEQDKINLKAIQRKSEIMNAPTLVTITTEEEDGLAKQFYKWSRSI